MKKDNWSVSWTKTSNENFMIVFSCPQIGTNILYLKNEIEKLITGESETAIPVNIMVDTLQALKAA